MVQQKNDFKRGAFTKGSKLTFVLHKVTCQRCGYEWMPRKENIRLCPRCHSPYWDKPKIQRDKAKCQRCGYEWMPFKIPPDICPKCKSRYWNSEKVESIICRQCGHQWVPKTDKKPAVCPSCKSYYWNRLKFPKYTGDYNLMVTEHSKPPPKSPPGEARSDNIELNRIHWEEENQRK